MGAVAKAVYIEEQAENRRWIDKIKRKAERSPRRAQKARRRINLPLDAKSKQEEGGGDGRR